MKTILIALFSIVTFSKAFGDPENRPKPADLSLLKYYQVTIKDAETLYKNMAAPENKLPIDPHGPDANQQIITRTIDVGDAPYVDRANTGGNIHFECEQRYPMEQPKLISYKCGVTVHNITKSANLQAEAPKSVIVQELSDGDGQVKLDLLYFNAPAKENALFSTLAKYQSVSETELLKTLDDEAVKNDGRFSTRKVRIDEYVDLTCDYDKFPIRGFPVRCKVTLHNIK